MNQHHFKLTYTSARTVVAAALVAAIGFTAIPSISVAAGTKATEVERVELRIKSMHAKLKITPDEEEKWSKVSDVMRENAKKMDALTQTRINNVKTMNAIEDLKSYGEIVDAHAEAIRKFAPVFENLYASMTDAQKLEADELFRQGANHKPRQKK
jgi:hypothetical protein